MEPEKHVGEYYRSALRDLDKTCEEIYELQDEV